MKKYLQLMRLHKPIGILLLLWPTLWALWLSGHGHPHFKIAVIFIAGVIIMRSAGCVINDIADRHVDKFVERTRERPITARKISVRNAFILFSCLMGVAFFLVCLLNQFTIFLAVVGALLTIMYPFLKRFTHLPQLGLGVAFAWGVPMAFAAQTNSIPWSGWQLFFAAALWPVMYDTLYAMVDRKDDVMIGVKSTAILFGKHDRRIVGIMQCLLLALFVNVGFAFHLGKIYFYSVMIAALLFLYQLYLIKDRSPQQCFKAFINNHWVGLVIFLGIYLV